MKTTFELPDDLVKEIKLRAEQEGKKLKDTVADLLRRGLKATDGRGVTGEPADAVMLRRRNALIDKFITGELGVELTGIEEAREVDRRKARERENAGRD